MTVSLGRLETGRPYLVRVTLVAQTAPSDEGRVEVHLDSSDTPITGVLQASSPLITAQLIPSDQDDVHLILTGAGPLGDLYRVRVEWSPAPTDLMPGVEFIPSPNQNVRPPGATINTVVVHATVSPTLESTVNWFLTPRSQVSAHYVVGKDGKIVQMVEDTARAWHAGVSEMEGVKGVNDFSVGIEIVNLNDGRDPYTDAQYTAVAAIIRHLREQYAIPDSRIVSHEFIARPPGRKSDPRGFDFARLLRMIGVKE